MPTEEMCKTLMIEALYMQYTKVCFQKDTPGRRHTFGRLLREDPGFMALGPMAQFFAVEGLV